MRFAAWFVARIGLRRVTIAIPARIFHNEQNTIHQAPIPQLLTNSLADFSSAAARRLGKRGIAVAWLALFPFGGDLALAGHRSHLYQSSNTLVAYLAGPLRFPEPKSTETHP